MRLVAPDVEAFIQRLKEEDREPFREKYGDILDDLEESDVESIISNSIFERKLHTELVKATASGFSTDTTSPGNDSKFIFYSTDPLAHQKPNKADVVLVRAEQGRIHFAIVICEIGESSVKKWAENIDSSYDVFNDSNNIDLLKEQMNKVGKKTGSVQYILLAPKTDLNSVPFAKLEKKVQPSKFAIWSGEVDDPAELCHEYGNNIHKDLKDVGTGCFDWASEAENPIKYTAATHPLIPLQVVTFQIIRDKKIFDGDDHPLEFNKDEFREEYKSHLQVESKDDVIDHLVRHRTKEIFELAEQIGIYSDSKSDMKTVRDYRIMFPGNTDDPLDARKAVKDKYERRAKEQKKKQLAFERAKESFDSLQADLHEWSKDDSSQWDI